ncbi:MAG: transglutaminase domain-containing protein [Eggerthellaceae bacterium]|nr:transglutaminase domain-containing protein [Eggerthellaceae bacterium]
MAQAVRKAGALALAAVVAATLSVGSLAAPAQASAQAGDLAASGASLGTQAAMKFGATKASAIKSAAKKDADAIIKAAKATSGTGAERLSRIFAYIATPKGKYGGKLISSESYATFWAAAQGNANKAYYNTLLVSSLKDTYQKFAVDAYTSKKASCYHYAALFAVTAKRALGKAATVKVAVGAANYSGELNNRHAWVEVTMGKVTYLYDASAGNYYISKVSKKKGDFGQYCGTKKSDAKIKKVYQGFSKSKVSYATVTL